MTTIVSNMTGTVLEVHVHPGETVQEGQDIITLEAMKMQMGVPATAAGRVTEVRVAAGAFVSEGDPLVILE